MRAPAEKAKRKTPWTVKSGPLASDLLGSQGVLYGNLTVLEPQAAVQLIFTSGGVSLCPKHLFSRKIIDHGPNSILPCGTVILAQKTLLARQKRLGGFHVHIQSGGLEICFHGFVSLFRAPEICRGRACPPHGGKVKQVGAAYIDFFRLGPLNHHSQAVALYLSDGAVKVRQHQDLSGGNGDAPQPADRILYGAALL